ncbi:hypothetical protein CRUP_012620, partial [Coryphaenoides rupestris]
SRVTHGGGDERPVQLRVQHRLVDVATHAQQRQLQAVVAGDGVRQLLQERRVPPPRLVQLRRGRQAAAQHVEAVAHAGLDERQAAAVRAVHHPHQAAHALPAEQQVVRGVDRLQPRRQRQAQTSGKRPSKKRCTAASTETLAPRRASASSLAMAAGCGPNGLMSWRVMRRQSARSLSTPTPTPTPTPPLSSPSSSSAVVEGEDGAPLRVDEREEAVEEAVHGGLHGDVGAPQVVRQRGEEPVDVGQRVVGQRRVVGHQQGAQVTLGEGEQRQKDNNSYVLPNSCPPANTSAANAPQHDRCLRHIRTGGAGPGHPPAPTPPENTLHTLLQKACDQANMTKLDPTARDTQHQKLEQEEERREEEGGGERRGGGGGEEGGRKSEEEEGGTLRDHRKDEKNTTQTRRGNRINKSGAENTKTLERSERCCDCARYLSIPASDSGRGPRSGFQKAIHPNPLITFPILQP